MSLRIIGNFDGGNPQSGNAILHRGEGEFTIHPFSEDGDPNYKFRMDLKIFNTGKESRPISLTVDWETDEFMVHRDYCFLREPGAEGWRYIPAEVKKVCSLLNFQILPGESYLCLHPKYNYDDYLHFIHGLDESETVKKRLLGVSREGREVWMVKISHPERPARKNLLAVARIHPYETSGSYCIEGILDSFRRPSAMAMEILIRCNLYIVPMISPDGVFHGYGKLTTPGGVDLSKTVDMADASCVLLKTLIDETRPSVYVEFHNWMFKDVDGIYFMNYLQSRKFIRSMPPQKVFEKRWRPILRRKILSTPCFGFKKYCKENFRSVSVCLEYPWFGRSPEHVKTLGMHSIMALSRM
jgi:hypothetical protein